MRDVDWKMSIAVRNHWHGRDSGGIKLCPLLADLDRLLKHLDEIGLKPGHAIAQCEHCGDEHRWVLIKELMLHALELRPPNQSKLLEEVDKGLESVRELYGGKEKYEEMKREAEAFFATLPPGNRYTP
jgi:hypothetical protein